MNAVKLKRIEQILRKSEADGSKTTLALSLGDAQWAALIAALFFWKQQVKQNEEDPGVGIYETCGVAGIDGILEQLEEELDFVLEA
jgi:hypothetical protein